VKKLRIFLFDFIKQLKRMQKRYTQERDDILALIKMQASHLTGKTQMG